MKRRHAVFVCWGHCYLDSMCNLYSITKGQKAIRDLAKAMVDHAGNMPSLPAVFPNRKLRQRRAKKGGE